MGRVPSSANIHPSDGTLDNLKESSLPQASEADERKDFPNLGVDHPTGDILHSKPVATSPTRNGRYPGSSIPTIPPRGPLDVPTSSEVTNCHSSKSPKDGKASSPRGKKRSRVRALSQETNPLPLLLPRHSTGGTAKLHAVTIGPSPIRNSKMVDSNYTALVSPRKVLSYESGIPPLASDTPDQHQRASITDVATSDHTSLEPEGQSPISSPTGVSMPTMTSSRKRSSIIGEPDPTGSTTEPHSNHDDLPFDLRNKRMKPTDCLLFAATLLEDASSSSLPVSQPTSSPIEAVDDHFRGSSPNNGDPTQPRDVDVLCGRGGLINKHLGNIIYRRVVEYNKAYYSSVQKKHRILVSQSIVQSMLNFGCRFLILGSKHMKSWTEIDFKKAVQKTSQALREKPINLEDGEDEKEVVVAMATNSSSSRDKSHDTTTTPQRINFKAAQLMKSLTSHEERSRIDTKKIQVG